RDLRFNVPLNARIGSTVTVGHRSFTLTEKEVEIPVHKDQVVALFDGRVKIRSADGGRLCFPCSPFNPYSADHRSGIHAACLRFEVPVKGVNRPTRIRLSVAK
ncbi:MAG: hypothetical protein JXR37_02985, partial [Kiritimatiellae bacterium]|nr:hypothetical protein [Kiritimatiellia bacterium]